MARIDGDNESHPGTRPGVRPDQEKAIVALLNQPTVAKAAEQAGVGERTVYRWLAEPAFSRAYRDARRESFRHAVALTQRYAALAVQTLAKVMADTSCSPSAKVAAATSLLKFSRESIELDDLAARVEVLEQTAESPAASWQRGAA